MKRNSPKYHEGIRMYLRQMEDYSRPVTLELEKDIFQRKKVLFVCYVDKKRRQSYTRREGEIFSTVFSTFSFLD